MSLNSRAGELAVLAGLTVFFAAIAVSLALTGHDTGPAATALIGGVPATIGGVLVLLRGDHPPEPPVSDPKQPGA